MGSTGRWGAGMWAMLDGDSDAGGWVLWMESCRRVRAGGVSRQDALRQFGNVGSKGHGRESKGVCGSLEGPRKLSPEPLPALRPKLTLAGRRGGRLGCRSRGTSPPSSRHLQGCAHQGGGGLGRSPALSAGASGVSSERLFSIHGATQSLPHLLSTASPVI